jgi:hypothetical protein
MAAGTFKRVLGIIFCCIEMLLLPGVMLGWIFLVEVLRNDGVFTDICLNDSTNQNNATSTLKFRDIKLMVEEDVNKQRFRRTLQSNDLHENVRDIVRDDIGFKQFDTIEGRHATARVAPAWSIDISLAAVSPITSKDGWYGILPFKGYRCEEEWQTYVFIYLAAIFGAPFLLLIVGILYDSCGTWMVRIVSM